MMLKFGCIVTAIAALSLSVCSSQPAVSSSSGPAQGSLQTKSARCEIPCEKGLSGASEQTCSRFPDGVN